MKKKCLTKFIFKVFYLLKLLFTSNILILFICYTATTEVTGKKNKKDKITSNSSEKSYYLILNNVLVIKLNMFHFLYQ